MGSGAGCVGFSWGGSVSDTPGAIATVVHDDFVVSSNTESEKQMRENFESEAKSPDGKDEDPKEAEKKKRSEAAAELGKAGGEATAKARAEADKDKEPDKAVPKVEAKPKEEKADEPDKDKEGDPRLSARARVMEATRKAADEKRAREKLEARLAKLEAEREPSKREAKPAPIGDEKPTPDKYETYEEYVEALSDYKVEQRVKKLTAEAEVRQQAETHTQGIVKRVETFNERLTKAEKDDPGLLGKVDPRLLELTPTFLLPPNQGPTAASDIAQAVLESEQSPVLLLHLSEHPDEMQRLLRLPDSYAVARAIGALEARLSDGAPKAEEKKEKEEPVSQARPPVKPVSGSPQVGDDEPGEDASLDDHIRIYNARDAKARRGR